MKINLSNMSKKSKTIAVTAFVLGVAVVGAGTFGSTTAIASTLTANGTNQRTAHITSLVTALSQRFNLNSTDVKTVIDSVLATEKTEMEANRANNLATRLAKAVTDGKITQAQSVLITTKLQETKTFMDSLKSKTTAERKTAMKTYQESLTKWATDNNIPKQFIVGGHMGMKGHGEFDGGFPGGPMAKKGR